MATKQHLYNKSSGLWKAMVFSSLEMLLTVQCLLKPLVMENLLFRSFMNQESPLAPSNPIFYARSIFFSA